MNNVKINNEINLTYPDGFNEMGEEELKKYFGTPNNRWGVHDAPNHVILSVCWTKKGFFSFFADPESFLIGAESRLHKRLLNYQRIGQFKTKIASKKAQGIRFEYRVNDSVVVQVCDLYAFKHKNKIYAVYYILRKNDAIEKLPGFEEILKSITAD